DTQKLEAMEDRQDQHRQAMRGYSQGCVMHRYPIWPGLEKALDKPIDRAKAVEGLAQARKLLVSHAQVIQKYSDQSWRDTLDYCVAAGRAMAHQESFESHGRPRVSPRQRQVVMRDLQTQLEMEKQSLAAMAKPWHYLDYRMTT